VEVAGALEVGAVWRPMPAGGARGRPTSRAAGVEGSGVETTWWWTTRNGGGGGRSGVEGTEGASQRSMIGHWRGSRVGGRRAGLYTLALRYRVKT